MVCGNTAGGNLLVDPLNNPPYFSRQPLFYHAVDPSGVNDMTPLRRRYETARSPILLKHRFSSVTDDKSDGMKNGRLRASYLNLFRR